MSFYVGGMILLRSPLEYPPPPPAAAAATFPIWPLLDDDAVLTTSDSGSSTPSTLGEGHLLIGAFEPKGGRSGFQIGEVSGCTMEKASG